MAWTLTVTDNADGTGATVKVSAPTNDGYYLERATVTAAGTGPYVDALGGVQAGGGTYQSEGLDYYSWRVRRSVQDDVVAGPVYQPATAKGDSVYQRCLVMIRDMVASLELPDLGDEDIYVREISGVGDNMSLPAVLVTDEGNVEETKPATNMEDDYGYPVSVFCLDGESPKGETETGPSGDAGRLKYYRQQIHRAIDQQRWDRRVPEVYKCEVRPAVVKDAAWLRKFCRWQDALLVVCWARHKRPLPV